MRDGFIKVAAGTPQIRVADCRYNAEQIFTLMREADKQGVRVLALPELCLTGYTCGDLFLQDTLLRGAEEGLATILEATKHLDLLAAVGLPVRHQNKLYNCAAVLHRGEILALVPKPYLPNYGEFYEKRWFEPAGPGDRLFSFCGQEVYLGSDVIFPCESMPGLTVGVEICEDLWASTPPSVALAEAVAGSEEAFVALMNQRASELGMEHTHFLNCTGLPASGHVTCAYDIALMSRALILNHPEIREFTTIWMDTLRDGQFQLSNTNKLIRFYEGATGLKTGSTDSALYCLSATAEKEGMELIAVILGAPTSSDRFEGAKALLNYGFAAYALVPVAPSEPLTPVPVTLGTAASVQPGLAQERQLLLPKGEAGKVTTTVDLPSALSAPVEAGQELGHLTVLVDGQAVEEIPLVAQEAVGKRSLWQVYGGLLALLFCGAGEAGF